MTRLIQKARVKCHTEKREKRDGWVNRLVSFLSDISKEVLSSTEPLSLCLFCFVCIRLILAVRIGSQHMQRQRDKDDADTAIRQCFQQMSALHQ